jgi:hypothetical protein
MTDDRHREVEFEVSLMVPGAGGDPVARLHAQFEQDVHKAMRPLFDFTVVRPIDRSVTPATDDLLYREKLSGPTQMLGMTSGQSVIIPFIVFLAPPSCLAGRFKTGDRPMIYLTRP